MSGGYLNNKKVERLRVKFDLPNLHSACIGNGDHLLYLFMKDGNTYIEVDGNLFLSNPWHVHSSDMKMPIPITET